MAAKQIAAGIAKQVAVATAAKATAAVTTASAMGPVGIGLLLIQGLSMALDIADVGGYGILNTWKIMKQELEKIATPPTIIGPLDELYLTPDLTQSQIPSSTEKSPNPSLFTSLLGIELPLVMKKDPEYINFTTNLNNTILLKYKGSTLSPNQLINAITTEFEQKLDTFLNSNKIANPPTSYLTYFTMQATDNICIARGGTLTPGGQCMYPKSLCNSSNLGDYSVAREWSDKQNMCLSINPTIEGICSEQKMVYDVDSGICQMTANMCLTKAGTPTPSNASGNEIINECNIPTGIQVCGMIIGDTICKGLDQVFNLNQYEPCDSNQVDVDYLCRDKCNEHYVDRAGVCWASTKNLGPANQCDSNSESNGSSLCYPKCRDGYDYQGVESHLVHDLNFCVKKCSEYKMRNEAGVCWGVCEDGYDDTGALCQAHTYTVTPHPAKMDGPRGTTYTTNCAHYDRICGDDCSKGWDDCRRIGAYGECLRGCRESCSNGACNTYYNCDNGYNKTTGGVCTWVGGATCNDNQQMFNSMCYDKCRDGYSMKTQGICSKDGDLTKGKPTVTPDRYGNGGGTPANCGGNDNVAGQCYEKCPPGLTRVPGTENCSKNGVAGNGDSYVPNTYPKRRKVPFSTK